MKNAALILFLASLVSNSFSQDCRTVVSKEFSKKISDECKITIGETIKLTEKEITWDVTANCETASISVKVFNRWGEAEAEVNAANCAELVLKMNEALDRNKIVEDVYFFTADISFASDAVAQISGYVSILR